MKNKKPDIDEERTAELDLPELQVIAGKGDSEHFFCIPIPTKAHPVCPRCGNSAARNQGKIRRNYYHVIPRGEKSNLVTISLEFRKHKCLASNCGCVYYPKFSFVSPYARTTRKLADVIVGLHIPQGIDDPLSFTEISEQFSGKISPQVVRQIYLRRLSELEAGLSDVPAWYREIQENELHYSSSDLPDSDMSQPEEAITRYYQDIELLHSHCKNASIDSTY